MSERLFAIFPNKELTNKQLGLAVTLTDALMLTTHDSPNSATGLVWVDSVCSTRYNQTVRDSWLCRQVSPPKSAIITEEWNRATWSMPKSVGIILGQTSDFFNADRMVSNAGPFGFRLLDHTLYGCHTGWVLDSHKLASSLSRTVQLKYRVDSANLFCALAMWPENYYQSVLYNAALKGKVATIFTRGGHAYIFRDSSSLIVQAYVPELDSTIMASSVDMIENAADLSGVIHDPATVSHVQADKVWKRAFHNNTMSYKTSDHTHHHRDKLK